MKKLPYGISDYEKIIKDNYYYVDKTMNIEKLENLSEALHNVFASTQIWENVIYKYFRTLL